MPAGRKLHDLDPRRIALIKPSSLGDIVHALPVLSALKGHFPSAHFTWIVASVFEPLICSHPHLDATVAFNRRIFKAGWLPGIREHGRFLKALGERQFDLAIDLQGLFRTGVMALATRAPCRIGLRSAREGARCFYTHVVDDLDGVTHAVDRYWRVVESLGAGKAEKRFLLSVDDAARAWACHELAGYPRPWLAVSVGSRWATKRWPPEHFAILVHKAQEKFGGSSVLLGAPDEIELSRKTAQLIPGPVHQLTGKTTLPQLTALLSEVDVVLANDTGPLHLAVALGQPVVAPYTCTVVARTGPYGQAHQAVETGVWCRGSYLKRCERLECMAELQPARLWPVLEQILLSWQRKRLSA